jgi:hypothetical protein
MEDRHDRGFSSLTGYPEYLASCPRFEYPRVGEFASEDAELVQRRNYSFNVESTRHMLNVESTRHKLGDKTECEQQLMLTLRENCKVIRRMVEGSCPSMSEEAYIYSTQTGTDPSAAYSARAKCGSAPDSTQFAASSNSISSSSLLRMFEEVMVCLDQIDVAIDHDAVDAFPLDRSSFSPEPASRARKFGPGSSLRLLSAELRLKAAIVSSAAGSLRAKLEHSNSVRARLAAAADGLAAQLAHERQTATALRAKADAELARATKLEAEVRRLKVELDSKTRQVLLAEEKVLRFAATPAHTQR